MTHKIGHSEVLSLRKVAHAIDNVFFQILHFVHLVDFVLCVMICVFQREHLMVQFVVFVLESSEDSIVGFCSSFNFEQLSFLLQVFHLHFFVFPVQLLSERRESNAALLGRSCRVVCDSRRHEVDLKWSAILLYTAG